MILEVGSGHCYVLCEFHCADTNRKLLQTLVICILIHNTICRNLGHQTGDTCYGFDLPDTILTHYHKVHTHTEPDM